MNIKEKTDALVNELENVGIVPVIKLDNVNDAEKLAKAPRDGGINCAEVTFRAKGAEEVIGRMTKAYPDMLVGAGTVLTCEQADAAIKAGAKFCVAPGLNPKVVKHCLDKGVPFAPGLSSASPSPPAFLGKRNRTGSGARARLRKILPRRAGRRARLHKGGVRSVYDYALYAHGRRYGGQSQHLPCV